MKISKNVEKNIENLKVQDPAIADLVLQELDRQRNGVELIASENFTYRGALEAAGSILTNKYAEGYPGHRYYGGCEIVDQVEDLARKRACELFDCKFANVQPHCGSNANLAAYHSLLNIGDTIMGLSLDNGGHLTHGAPVSFSGQYYKSQSYTLNPDTEVLDYDMILSQAKKVKPQLIVAGYSAYPRIVDFAAFRRICDEVGAYLMVDMAHIAGLIAAGEHPSPLPYADIVTSTTHKTLCGPRGGMILTNNEEIAKKVDKAVFPGSQGGPLMHIIAAKAVCFKMALEQEYRDYVHKLVLNSKALAKGMQDNGLRLVSGGTDNHLSLADVSVAGVTGKEVEQACSKANITVNKNTIPNEKLSPFVTSGIRVGTPAITARDFDEDDCFTIGEYISRIAYNINDESTLENVREGIKEILKRRPLY